MKSNGEQIVSNKKPRTIEQKHETQQSVYNNSVKLLEFLNVIIPKLGNKLNNKLPKETIGEIATICFELGSDFSVFEEEFEEKPDLSSIEEEAEYYT